MNSIGVYADRMQEIVKRAHVVDAIITAFRSGIPQTLYLPTTVETIYLQFRFILELIATASLMVNEGAIEKLNAGRRRGWHAGDILRAVEEVNPEFFYPKPVSASEKGSITLGGVKHNLYEHKEKRDYLTRERFTTLYDVCNKVLHARGPGEQDYSRLLDDADKKWRFQIRALLLHHEYRLMGDDNLYVVQVRDEKHGDPLITTFAPYDSEPTSPA